MRFLRTTSILILALIAGWFVFGQLIVTKPFARFFYSQGRPNRVAILVNRAWSWQVASGLVPSRWPGKPVCGSTTVVVRGRHSGEERTTVATWIEHRGERYLVSMSGDDSDWVRNVRATAGEVELRRGARQQAVLEEVPVDQRAEIIRHWYRRTWRSTESRLGVDPNAGLDAFQRLARDHPVFRILTN